MATSEIKQLYGSSTAFTITLASLASSTSGAGRQSTVIDNTTTRYEKVTIYVKITQGSSPTGSRAVYVYLIRDDNNGTNYRSEGAGASDAALTVVNSSPILVIPNKSSPSTGDVLYGDVVVYNPGPKFAIAIVHDTGVNLDSTAGNHYVRYAGSNPEAQ